MKIYFVIILKGKYVWKVNVKKKTIPSKSVLPDLYFIFKLRFYFVSSMDLQHFLVLYKLSTLTRTHIFSF